jgi:uncharacterized oligopeptide transporter (OPT) family protein
MPTHPGDPLEPTPAVVDPYEDFELPVKGFKGTAEEVERQWYEQCYLGRGDTIAQLTWRAIIMGSVLGSILSLTNLYIGLKAGWGFGVAITACILSYAVWTTLFKMRLVRTRMTILENNCMQSTASSAGYSTGGTLVSAFAAYIMLNNHTLPLSIMFAWVFFLAVLGVTMAIPMKRQMINIEQLRFPSGIAAAETLRALHATGQKGIRAGKALAVSGALAALSTLWTDGLHLFAAGLKSLEISSNTFWNIGLLVAGDRLKAVEISAWVTRLNELTWREGWMNRTVMFVWDPIFIAAGSIVGMRVSLSIMFGAVTCWMIFVPAIQAYVPEAAGVTGYRDLVQWTLWGGVSCMVTSGLLSVGLQWRSAARAFKSLAAMFAPGRGAEKDPVDKIETPVSWFFAGQLFSLIALCWLAHYSFDMPYWQTTLAVALTFGLSLVACRVTGETDSTPTGAMGKIMQLIFGSVNPGNMNINLMSANITSGAAGSSADLLTDLKSGYLLGANPTKQFIAQFSGIFIGTIVTVLSFQVLVPDASHLGTDQFPAPAAQAWKGVAEAIGLGLASLHPVKIWSIVVGGLVGIVLPVLAKLFPKKAKYLPSPGGMGLAWTFHWFYSSLFFLGAIVGLVWRWRSTRTHEEFLFPIASGVIAGGALMGVLLIFIENGPEMVRKLLGG